MPEGFDTRVESVADVGYEMWLHPLHVHRGSRLRQLRPRNVQTQEGIRRRDVRVPPKVYSRRYESSLSDDDSGGLPGCLKDSIFFDSRWFSFDRCL